jgi:hypothetical protein
VSGFAVAPSGELDLATLVPLREARRQQLGFAATVRRLFESTRLSRQLLWVDEVAAWGLDGRSRRT